GVGRRVLRERHLELSNVDGGIGHTGALWETDREVAAAGFRGQMRDDKTRILSEESAAESDATGLISRCANVHGSPAPRAPKRQRAPRRLHWSGGAFCLCAVRPRRGPALERSAAANQSWWSERSPSRSRAMRK